MKQLSLDDITDKLDAIELQVPESFTKQVTKKIMPSASLLEAAAVLVFFDPEAINPIHDQINKDFARDDELLTLIGLSELVIGDPEETIVENINDDAKSKKRSLRYMLQSDLRREVILKLTSKNRIKIALDANPNLAYNYTFSLQQTFTNYLLDKLPPLSTLDLKMLNALQRISEWMESDFKYTSENLTVLVERAEMLKPFRHLTGKFVDGTFQEFFKGRKSELSVLRKYVGIAEPQGLMESLHRFYSSYFEPVFDWNKKPPLLIFGLGGSGKSTLLAKFLLEHADANLIGHFPFVYLDFDRAVLSALEPESLLIESARQLSIQFSGSYEAQKLTEFYERWKNRDISIEKVDTERITIINSGVGKRLRNERKDIISQFASTLAELSTRKNNPFLVVLDTFEEVQYKGASVVNQLFTFFKDLQKAYPSLRVVIAGRAPIKQLKTQELKLGDLDSEAAKGYLGMTGINDNDLKKFIVDVVGGNPLSLKLAAELVRQNGKNELLNVRRSERRYSLFEKRLSNEMIQGMLYQRILGHIHHPEVKKLANPGLVLRVITPEIILHVLKEPCKLQINTIKQANVLFRELKKEVSLVVLTEQNVLKHRADVRKVMLKLLANENLEQVNEIHRLAVLYYEEKDDFISKAEAFYHRLSLNEAPRLLDSYWQPGFENQLLSNIDEFSPNIQAFISGRTGIEIFDPSIWKFADSVDVDRHWLRQAENLLNHGHADELLNQLNEVDTNVQSSGITSMLKVLAMVQLSQFEEAIMLAKQTLNSIYAYQFPPLVIEQLRQVLAKFDKGSSADLKSDDFGEQYGNEDGQFDSSGFTLDLE
jgi:hypothetical protein